MRRKLIYVILLLSAATFAAGFFYTPRVKGRVEIEGISVQGKTEREARELLAPLLSAWQNRKVILVLPNGTGITVSAPILGFCTDFDAVWQRALSVKKRASASLSLTPTFSLNGFTSLSKEIATKFYLAPKNATLNFLPNTAALFSVTPEKKGAYGG